MEPTTQEKKVERLAERLAGYGQPVACMGLFPRWVRRGVKGREEAGGALGNTETLLPPELDGQIAPRGPLADGHCTGVAEAPSDAPASHSDADADAVRVNRRTERYRRQRVAQRVLDPSILSDADGWRRWRRVRACGRPFTPGSSSGDGPSMIEVRVYNESEKTAGRAYYGRLEHCHNVWVCPECSLRIRSARAAEVAAIVGQHCGQDHGAALLVTYTCSHHLGTPLAEVQEGLFNALRMLRSHRTYRRLKEALQLGFVRVYELTYGPNGWHCHFHELWLVNLPGDKLWADIAAQHAREVLVPLWRHCLELQGLTCDDVHGLDVRPVSSDWADAAGRYVAKITEGFTGSELTGTDNKLAAAGHIVPFQLLDRPKDKRARALWREYAEATRGKRSITFSQGLRARFGLDASEDDGELDASLLAKQDAISHTAAYLSAAAYRHVWARDRARLGQGLRAAEIGDWESFASMFPGCVIDEAATLPEGTLMIRTVPEMLAAREAARGPSELDRAVRAANMRLAQLAREHPVKQLLVEPDMDEWYRDLEAAFKRHDTMGIPIPDLFNHSPEPYPDPLWDAECRERHYHYDRYGYYSRYADRIECAPDAEEVMGILAEAERVDFEDVRYEPIKERDRRDWMAWMRNAKIDPQERAVVGVCPPTCVHDLEGGYREWQTAVSLASFEVRHCGRSLAEALADHVARVSGDMGEAMAVAMLAA